MNDAHIYCTPEQFAAEFNADRVTGLVFAAHRAQDNAHFVGRDSSRRDPFAELLGRREAQCGRLNQAQRAALFGDDALEGSHVVLPLLGPSTVRDTAGWAVDNRYDVWRTEVDAVGLRYGGSVLRLVDKRAGFLGMDTSLNEVALDKYTFVRDAYLQRRKAATQRKPSSRDGDDGDDGLRNDQ
jgi:hypothetical protein